MQISKVKEDGLTHHFTVVLAASEIDMRVDAKLDEIKDQVQLKGFRPGKVPRAHLKKTFGKSILGEAVENAVNESSDQAVREAMLRPAGKPKIEITKFEEGGDLEFSMVVDVMPEIPPLDARSLKLEREMPEITDADVEAAIERLARSSATYDSKDDGAAAEKDDQAVIDFLGTVDGVAFDGGKGEDFPLVLGSGQFIPGFEDQVIGAVKGEQRDVKVTFPESYGVDTLAGKDAVFAVTVKDIKAPKKVELDDAFAKGFGFDTFEALREGLRGQIAQEDKRRARAKLKRQLLDKLDGLFTFDLPQSLVEGEFTQILEQVGGGQPLEDETEKSELRKIAERRVRLGLVLAEVGRINNVQVAQEDLNRAVVEQARRYPGQERQVFDYFNKNPQAVAELRAPLFEEKVVDFVLELAEVSERSVSREAFLAQPSDEMDEAAS